MGNLIIIETERMITSYSVESGQLDPLLLQAIYYAEFYSWRGGGVGEYLAFKDQRIEPLDQMDSMTISCRGGGSSYLIKDQRMEHLGTQNGILQYTYLCLVRTMCMLSSAIFYTKVTKSGSTCQHVND